jgi:hypothetical protein
MPSQTAANRHKGRDYEWFFRNNKLMTAEKRDSLNLMQVQANVSLVFLYPSGVESGSYGGRRGPGAGL